MRQFTRQALLRHLRSVNHDAQRQSTGTIMQGGQDHATRGFRRVLFWAAAFFVVYVLIHIGLNLTAQGTRGLQWPQDWRAWVTEISGPVTVSLCSSLLIFSYGMFLLHGLKHLSVSAPSAFLNAFVIFVAGQILVQITGHLEIYVYNQLKASGPNPNFVLTGISALSYPLTFCALWLLEGYRANVFDALREQLPKRELVHANRAVTIWHVTAGSILLLALKILVLALDANSKFGVILFALGIEFIIAAFVVVTEGQRTRRYAEGHR